MAEEESAKTTIIKGVFTWLNGQPFNNVLIILLIAVITWAVYDAQHNVIPAERKAIEQMVERVEDRQSKQIDRICESFDKALDRTSRPLASAQE